MTKIVPLVYSGDGAEDYTCKVVTGKECGSPVHVIVRRVIEPRNPVYVNDQMSDVVHYLKDSRPEEAGQALGGIIMEIVDESLVDTDDSYFDNIVEGFTGELI